MYFLWSYHLCQCFFDDNSLHFSLVNGENANSAVCRSVSENFSPDKHTAYYFPNTAVHAEGLALLRKHGGMFMC